MAAHWYGGRDGHGREDLVWLGRDGARLRGDDWGASTTRAIGALVGAPGKATSPLLLLANPQADDVDFALPAGRWQTLIDSARLDDVSSLHEAVLFPLAARSVVLLESDAVPPT